MINLNVSESIKQFSQIKRTKKTLEFIVTIEGRMQALCTRSTQCSCTHCECRSCWFFLSLTWNHQYTYIPGCTLHIRCIWEIYFCADHYSFFASCTLVLLLWSCLPPSSRSFSPSIFLVQLENIHNCFGSLATCTQRSIRTHAFHTGYDNNFFYSLLSVSIASFCRSIKYALPCIRLAGCGFFFFFFEIQDQKFIASFWYDIKMKINIYF